MSAAAGPVGVLAGTELIGEFRGSGYLEASWLVRRFDGRVVRLAPVLYAVVAALGRRSPVALGPTTDSLAQVAEDVRSQTGIELTADHIAYLLDNKLAPSGITTNSDGSQPAVGTSDAFLALRLKKAVVPSSATWFLGGLFSWLFQPFVVVAVVTAALASEIWLFGSQPIGSAFANVLADPASLLLVGGLAVFSALFHEVGHATACRYGGVRPGPIGFGLYLVYPAFYTDITSSYRLDRSGRLRTVLGGVYFNALVIICLALCYLWTDDPVFAAAVLICNLELVQQLLPTLRFDGYYIVSDLAGIPDLFKYIGPILRRTLLRQPADGRLLALKPWPQRIVAIWVLLVTPVLIAQLAFLAFQVPAFIAAGRQRIKGIGASASTAGTDLLGVVGDVVLILLALLPLAGLLVLGVQAGRGVTNIVRSLHEGADESTAPGRATSALDDASGSQPAQLLITGQVVPIQSRGGESRSVAAQRFILLAICVLLVASGASLLSRGSSGDGQSLGERASSGVPAPVEIAELITFGDLSRTHVSGRVAYGWMPPPGGDHAPTWQRCGAYDEPVPNELAVHSMEHGAVWLAYRPDLARAEVDRLRRETRSSHVLVSPYPDLPAPVVATAWGHQLRLESTSDSRLEQFISRYRLGAQTPERQAGC